MKYEDIINYKYTGPKHPRMSKEKRASQFAPFSALTGYDEEVKEKARLTDNEFEHTKDLLNKLNNNLNYLEKIIKSKPLIIVTYFIKDKTKKGGKYEKYKGNLRIIDKQNQTIEFTSKYKINIKDINNIEIILQTNY